MRAMKNLTKSILGMRVKFERGVATKVAIISSDVARKTETSVPTDKSLTP